MDGAPVAEFRPTLTHGGRFLLYNIFGNQFEITSKYQPPIMPIGRGAYGIVWYVPLSFTIDFMPILLQAPFCKTEGIGIRPITAFCKQQYLSTSIF
jgi:hypothetical protein